MEQANNIAHAVLTLSGSAQQLSQTGGQGSRSLAIRAFAGNTGKVFLGGSGVTTANGYELNAGESITMDFLNLSQLWVVGTAADKVAWLALS